MSPDFSQEPFRQIEYILRPRGSGCCFCWRLLTAFTWCHLSSPSPSPPSPPASTPTSTPSLSPSAFPWPRWWSLITFTAHFSSRWHCRPVWWCPCTSPSQSLWRGTPLLSTPLRPLGSRYLTLATTSSSTDSPPSSYPSLSASRHTSSSKQSVSILSARILFQWYLLPFFSISVKQLLENLSFTAYGKVQEREIMNRNIHELCR